MTAVDDPPMAAAARWSRRDSLLVAAWIVGMGVVAGVIVCFVASPHLRPEFYFDEAWRADLIRTAHPLARYRTNNTPIPPMWIGAMRTTSLVAPDGFLGLRLQNTVYDIALPIAAGLLAGFTVGWANRVRAIAAGFAAAVVTAILLVVGGSGLYLNDYAFQALLVALAVLACALADRTGRGRVIAGTAIVVLPLATLGGLVVLPVLSVWWVVGDGRPTDRSAWLRRLVVPAVSLAIALTLYLWLYRPQIDGELSNFWANELLRDGTRGIWDVLVDIPRSIAINVVPPKYESFRNVGTGLAVIVLAIAGFPTLAKAWRWLPWVVGTSWPIAIVLSIVGGWPATFVRVNLPFAWLWYLTAVVGIGTLVGRLHRHAATAAFAACAVLAIALVPARTPASTATYARGLYRDLDVVAASPYAHNVVLSYHWMSHFYVDDELENLSGEGDRFTVVREVNGDDELYSATDLAILDAGWQPGDAVWCVVVYEIGPEASERACHVTLPGLTKQYTERLERATIIGWFPAPAG